MYWRDFGMWIPYLEILESPFWHMSRFRFDAATAAAKPYIVQRT
jgi:hypothetical protein